MGKEFLKICYQNNVVIDLAHGESSVDLTILRNYNGRVINSHTAIYDVNEHKRNIKTEIAEEICKRGGLIGVSLCQISLVENILRT